MNTYQISAFVFVQPSFMKIHQASLIDAEWITCEYCKYVFYINEIKQH